MRSPNPGVANIRIRWSAYITGLYVSRPLCIAVALCSEVVIAVNRPIRGDPNASLTFVEHPPHIETLKVAEVE